MEIASLLVPQRDHGIHLSRTPRGDVTGEQSNAQKENNRDRDWTRIGQLDTEKDAGNGLMERECSEDAQGRAKEGKSCAVTKHQLKTELG